MNCERMVSARPSRDGRDGALEDELRSCLINRCSRAAFAVLAALMLVSWFGSRGYCDDVDTLVNRALKLSGVEGQVKEMIPAMVEAFPGDAFSDSSLKRRVQRRVEAGLRDEALLEMVRDGIRKDFDHPKLEKILEFYESKLGRKIGRLLAGSLAARALSDVRQGRKPLALMPDSRRSLYERIVRAEQVSQTEGKLFEKMVAGLAEGSYGSQSEKAQAAQEKLNPLIDRAVSGGHILEQMAVAALARTFRSLSDEELGALATFEESDAARWYRRSTQPGLENIVYAIGCKLGSELRKVRTETGGQKR